MSTLKQYLETDVLTAARSRVAYAFDHFENIYVSFSGGKDSSVMLHLVMDEAIARDRKVGVLIIDLEAQYKMTIDHVAEMAAMYQDNIDLHWVCLPMSLRNAVSNFEPRWCCWEPGVEWVRQPPEVEGVKTDPECYPFFRSGMEFEEFMVLFGEWWGGEADTAGFVGIRCDESLNRFRTIASRSKETHGGQRFTTKVLPGLYNIYPVYDWKTADIWRYHAQNPDKPHNRVYDQMHKAGLTPHQMRLCQPYGDDQRRGLWLYHLIEPETWYALIARVNGVNSGALYVQETGNATGYNKISKPEGHTWKSFCNLLLGTMPEKTRNHYIPKFQGFLRGWAGRGYTDGIPDEAPPVLENKKWAPSWRRLCKVLLRNDYWCKGLGLTQPKSPVYQEYIEMRRKARAAE